MQMYEQRFTLRSIINLHGNRYNVIFRTLIVRAVKMSYIEQFANIPESESIAAFIMQTERNIYAFAVGLPPFFSYFCIIFDSILHPVRTQKGVQHRNHSDC